MMLLLFFIYDFCRSFMVVKAVKKALIERGWNPLNMNCLHHPDIICIKVPEETICEEDEQLVPFLWTPSSSAATVGAVRCMLLLLLLFRCFV